MYSITLQNYRCFGSEEQTARLAPLTLLVGPNSTGKTSFLALIRALWDVAFREVVPNFREEPYDLGSFEDIVSNGSRTLTNETRFFRGEFRSGIYLGSLEDTIGFAANFENWQTAPYPNVRTFCSDGVMVELRATESRDGGVQVRLRTGEITWPDPGNEMAATHSLGFVPLAFLNPMLRRMFGTDNQHVNRFLDIMDAIAESAPRLIAAAPTRSRPRRTYDPAVLRGDPEGVYIPSYLANLSRQAGDEWQSLKTGLEQFGSQSELFDEIRIRSFGRSDGDPFQIQVRKHSGPKSRRRKGPWHNVIDVGYGVSQALPMLTELLRPEPPTMFLLQQPEVHLHPQAQAALGTLFCKVAAGGRQLLVETHSDYIIDRVRMDVRDQTTGLKPEDVSILYFEPRDLDVKIHSIRLDEMGNVLDAPASYGKFFMDEINRSIGLVKPDVRNSR